jgi:hypothetical protein
MKLIILYDDNEKGLPAFFAEMKKHLQPGPGILREISLIYPEFLILETEDEELEPSPPEGIL